MKSIFHFSLLVLTFSGLGCGQSEQGRGVDKSPAPQASIKLAATDTKAPLTDEEVTQFLEIVQRMPKQEVPAFSKADLSLSVQENEDFGNYVANLRRSLRSAINPEAQGAKWIQEKSLARAFQSAGVSPENFAKLSTKVTLAWSATAIKGEVPILLTHRRLTEQLEQAELKFREQSASPGQQREILKRVQELVALSEFLQLVENTSEASLKTIRKNEARLGEVLPKLELAAQFEKFLSDAPEVAQTKYTIH